MSDLIIQVRDGVFLSAIRLTDKPALLKHLHSRDVYNTTLNIPHPYTETDADFWLRKRVEHCQRIGKEASFAIRDGTGEMIGVIGADNFEPGLSHRAEIGYWLAREYWGQGLATDVVGAYIRYAFSELGVLRLTAHVFEFNIASARVLEKNGFALEGRFRKHFLKDGRLVDARFYGLLKEDLNPATE